MSHTLLYYDGESYEEPMEKRDDVISLLKNQIKHWVVLKNKLILLCKDNILLLF